MKLQSQIIFMTTVLIVGSLAFSYPGKESYSRELTEAILLVISKQDEKKIDQINQYMDWKKAQGFEVWSIEASKFPDSLSLKQYFKSFKVDHPNLVYAILPVNEFLGEEQVIDESKIVTQSDFYFCNLDDDKKMIPEIYISRATIDELVEIKQKKCIPLKSVFAYPIVQFRRWIINRYTRHSDFSLMGEDLRKISKQKNIASVTLFEQEGYVKSDYKPTLPLNQENFTKEFKDSNIVFAMNTWEPIEVYEIGKYQYYNYLDLTRAVWTEDADKSDAITNNELSIQTYFKFDDYPSDSIHRIGFLPIKSDGEFTKNLFSSVVLINPMTKFKTEVLFFIGDGTGLVPSVCAVHRIISEAILSNVPISKAVFDCYHKYKEKFPADPHPNEMFATRFYVRGDPTISISDLLPKAKFQIIPETIQDSGIIEIPLPENSLEFSIKNIGKVEVDFQFAEVDQIGVEPISGKLKADEEIKIKVFIKPKKIPDLKPLNTLKKKCDILLFKSNAGDKVLLVKWLGV